MLKKRLIACIAIIGVFFPSLCGLSNTYADDQNEPLLVTVEHVTQNNTELTMDDKKYVFSDYYSPITVTFKIDNLTIGENYSGYLNSPSLSSGYQNFSGTADDTSVYQTITFNPSMTSRYNNASIQFYTETREKFSYVQIYNENLDFVELGDYLYINSVVQDNVQILPKVGNNGHYIFEVKDSEPFSFTINVRQAMDYATYSLPGICESEDMFSFTGAELKEGVTITGQCWVGDYIEEINLSGMHLQGSSSFLSFNYYNGGEFMPSDIIVYKNDSAPRITSANVEYANYPNELIHDVVDLRYHDQNNPLKLTFGGRNFSDNESYSITVKLFHTTDMDGTQEVEYEREITVSGQELNSGKSITLDTVVLELMDEEHLILDANMYDLEIYYENQHLHRGLDYGYGFYGHLGISAFATDDNNERFISNYGSAPAIGVGTIETDPYLHFYVPYLPKNEEFKYEIFRMQSDSFNSTDGELVKSGILSGRELGYGKISMPVEDGVRYYLLIKNDFGIIRWQDISFYSNPDATGIDGIGASIDNLTLNILYDNSYPHYNVAVGDTVKLTLYGKNYDENKNYSIKMFPMICGGGWGMESGCRGGFEGDDETVKVFTGKELNDGNAYFELPYLEGLQNELMNGGIWDIGGVSFSVDGNNVNWPTIYFSYIEKTASFTAKLSSDDTFEDDFDVFLSVGDYENLAGANGGIAALMGDVEYDDTKLELISVEGMNDFELISGDHYVLHNIYGQGAPEGTNILKLTFRNKGLESGESTTVSFTNISGSDGVNDITTADVSKTITYYEAEASIDSDTYTIIGNLISKIATGTLVNIFKNGLELGGHATIRILSVNNVELSSTDKVGTGVKVQLLDRHGEVVSEFTIVIKGDISGDGEITITDLVKAKRHLAGLDNYTGVFQLAGDVSKTGAISITDVVKICRHVAGLEVINQ